MDAQELQGATNTDEPAGSGADAAAGGEPAANQTRDVAELPSEEHFPVVRVSGDGIILYANEPGRMLLKQWRQDIGGRAPNDWCELVAEALASRKNKIKEFICKDHIFSFVVAPLAKTGCVNLYGRDITAAKETEQSLKKADGEMPLRARQRLSTAKKNLGPASRRVYQHARIPEAFFSRTMTPVAILDQRFDFIRVNNAYAQTTGRDILEFPGHNYFELYPSEEDQQIFERVVTTKTSYQATAKPFCHGDHPEWGTTYWDLALVPVLDEGRQVELLIVALQDVTESKRSELALRQSEARYRSLVEASPDAIAVLTAEQVLFANPACVELVAASDVEDLTGKHIQDRVHPHSRDSMQDLVRSVLEHKTKVPPREMKLLRRDGEPVEVEIAATPVTYEDKPAVQIILRDIADRKQTERQTEATNNLLKRFVTESSRKQYLDSVVHLLGDWTQCRCVGIRLIDAKGYIPYESSIGFSENFLKRENMVALHSDVCACDRVIREAPQPQDAAAMTANGSFWCQNFKKFLDGLTEQQGSRFLQNCAKQGFLSIAVIPIRYGEKTIGVVHLADKQQGKVSLELVEFLESVAGLIGGAIHRFDVEFDLRRSEQHYRTLAELSPDGIILENQGMIELVNVTGAKLLGGEVPEEFTGKRLMSFVHRDCSRALRTRLQHVRTKGKAMAFREEKFLRMDGSGVDVELAAVPLGGRDKTPIQIVFRDITERKQAGQELRKKQRELRSLAAEVELSEERQRRAIAADLYDSVEQILHASAREIPTLQKSIPPEAAGPLRQVGHQINQAIEQTQTLAFNLSPGALYDRGFEAAVEELVKRFAKKRDIRHRFANSKEPKPLSEQAKVLLYRSVREILVNVAEQGKTEAVRISLARAKDDIRIAVRHDGKGFDPSAFTDRSAQMKSLRILGIHERLAHIGGCCKLRCREGKGITVTISAPLSLKQGRIKSIP
jgi:PAS domain S-box-containing protein